MSGEYFRRDQEEDTEGFYPANSADMRLEPT